MMRLPISAGHLADRQMPLSSCGTQVAEVEVKVKVEEGRGAKVACDVAICLLRLL